jgi:hypothetical protein
MGLGGVSDHATRVDLEVRQRDHVFGEFHAHRCRALSVRGAENSTSKVV